MSLKTPILSAQRPTFSLLRPRLATHLHGSSFRRSNAQLSRSPKADDDTSTITHVDGDSNNRPGSSKSTDGYQPSKAAWDRWQRWAEANASALRGRAATVSSAAFASLGLMGRKLNHITGYEEIEALKQQVVDKEIRMNEIRQAARQAKDVYDEAVSQRAKSQREVNDLLQRKSSWTDDDVGRFTLLVRQDHLFEQAEAKAKAEAHSSEDAVEKEFNELMRTILARYHEEQVWSDKIRSASTYGSLAVLGMNLVVFILAIILVEPWKRKRLLETFEKRVAEMNGRHQAVVEEGIRSLHTRLDDHARELSRLAATTVSSDAIDDEPRRTSPDQLEDPISRSLHLVDFLKDRKSIAVAASSAFGCAAIGWLLRSMYG